MPRIGDRGKLLVVIIVVTAVNVFALWFVYDRFGWQLPFSSSHKITETLSAFMDNVSDAINAAIRLMHEKTGKLVEFLNKQRH